MKQYVIEDRSNCGEFAQADAKAENGSNMLNAFVNYCCTDWYGQAMPDNTQQIISDYPGNLLFYTWQLNRIRNRSA